MGPKIFVKRLIDAVEKKIDALIISKKPTMTWIFEVKPHSGRNNAMPINLADRPIMRI